MPKRNDLNTILVIGAGPIVIGQACEFDYSGVQACKALREAGYKVVLVNSNPATIMTDPVMADATYIEPIHWETVARIIEKERPCALLPTMGGQTALNCAMALSEKGVLDKYDVALIGVDCPAIENAEDRQKFIACMEGVGLQCPRSRVVTDLDTAMHVVEDIGFPVVIRPSFTLGGAGGGIAYNKQELTEICQQGFSLSPVHQVLLDQSIIGWKEFETEVIRDKSGNAIVVCTIENVDPLGVHTGDSITVAPAQTLTDKEYQVMRTASFTVLDAVGMQSGAANVQFAVNPKNGELNVIEMNPRVSRSSALASKATGFPIARIAAMLSVGYTLDELRNDITRGKMPASFEPSLDYVVTKIPRFNFDKFPETDPRLTTKMKSVGEVMAIGRNFQESLQKAISGLEVNRCGLESPFEAEIDEDTAKSRIRAELINPSWDRIWYIAAAFRYGFTQEEVVTLTKMDAWFIVQIQDLVISEQALSQSCLQELSAERLYALKRQGFSDKRIGQLLSVSDQAVRQHRKRLDVVPVFKRVDSCAAEFPTETAYLYSTYDTFSEARVTSKPKIMVLGGGAQSYWPGY